MTYDDDWHKEEQRRWEEKARAELEADTQVRESQRKESERFAQTRQIENFINSQRIAMGLPPIFLHSGSGVSEDLSGEAPAPPTLGFPEEAAKSLPKTPWPGKKYRPVRKRWKIFVGAMRALEARITEHSEIPGGEKLALRMSIILILKHLETCPKPSRVAESARLLRNVLTRPGRDDLLSSALECEAAAVWFEQCLLQVEQGTPGNE